MTHATHRMENDESEEWRPFPFGFDNYLVSSLGRFVRPYDSKTWKSGFLKPYQNGRYLQVTLRRNRKKVKYSVHRIVAIAFLGEEPFNGAHVAHWDGNPHNNRVNNLRWATPTENASDGIRLGRTCRGMKNANAKLNESDVRMILNDSRPSTRLARIFGVSWSTIKYVRSGKTWRHIPRAFGLAQVPAAVGEA